MATVSAGTRPEVRWRLPCFLGALAALVYLVAVARGQDQLVNVTIAIASVMSLISPFAGLAMVTLIMPMQEPPLLIPLGPVGVVVAAVSFGCFLRLPRDRITVRLHPGTVLLFGYLVISAISLLPWISGNPSRWTSSAANELWRVAVGRPYSYRRATSSGSCTTGCMSLWASSALLWPRCWLSATHSSIRRFALFDGLLSQYVSIRAAGGFWIELPRPVRGTGGCVRARPDVGGAPTIAPSPRAGGSSSLAAVAVSFSREAFISVAVGAVIFRRVAAECSRSRSPSYSARSP